jgi:hypothetical protein
LKSAKGKAAKDQSDSKKSLWSDYQMKILQNCQIKIKHISIDLYQKL